jgi:AhpD family alkylhydroperoxidase
MDARFNYYSSTVAAKFAKYINSAGAVVSDSALPAATQELVKIRASQINGCAACTDMHTEDAGHAGESPVRLNLVAVWREAKVFTEAERAALELTEQGTRIADAGGLATIEEGKRHHRLPGMSARFPRERARLGGLMRGGRPLAGGCARRQGTLERTLGPYRRCPRGKSFPLRQRRGEGHVARGRLRGDARVRRWHRVTSPEGTA